MADYWATCRSNYFHVVCRKSFDHWAWRCVLVVWPRDDGRVAITTEEQRGWPVERGCDHPEDTDWEDFDLFDELAGHLQEGEVAVLLESGSEKARVIGGYAVAVTRDKKAVQISLDDIYAKAAENFSIPIHRIGRAEY